MKTPSRFYHALAVVTVAVLGSLTVGIAAAHIKNEASQFPDIEFSDARFDIVVLVGAGIIPETPVFEPDAPFSRFDLATWAALAENLGVGGKPPTPMHLLLRRWSKDWSNRPTDRRPTKISTMCFLAGS